MPLPLTRDYNAADLGPLPAATVNNIQDAIINNGHGLLSVIQGHADWQVYGVNVTIQTGSVDITGAASGILCAVPRECVGLQIVEFIFRGYTAPAATRILDVSLYAYTDAGVLVGDVTAIQSTSGVGGTAETLTFNAASDPGVLPYTMIAAEYLYVHVRDNAGGLLGTTSGYSLTWGVQHP